MNQELMDMARQAGFFIKDNEAYSPSVQEDHELTPFLEAFAALVAAAEREAIAQMIEDAPLLVEFAQNNKGGCMVCGFTPKLAAETIRARGEKK